MLEELVATDGNHGDECHELLEVALRVAVGVQTLHQAVQRGLVFDVLQGQRSEVRSLLSFQLLERKQVFESPPSGLAARREEDPSARSSSVCACLLLSRSISGKRR